MVAPAMACDHEHTRKRFIFVENLLGDPSAPKGTYRGVTLEQQELVASDVFDLAYEAAEGFTDAL